MTSRPKFEYVRSLSLLCACRAIPCQNCGVDDGSVVAAHSNSEEHGKGRSVKSSDIYIASLCHRCHMELDQGSKLSRQERQAMWWRAHCRTVLELVRRGLWPKAVTVPNIETCPFDIDLAA